MNELYSSFIDILISFMNSLHFAAEVPGNMKMICDIFRAT